MKPKKIINNVLKVLLPMALGGGILYWMYRGFDWQEIGEALRHDVRWGWMLATLPFGVLAQILRAMRWKQLLAPVDERPRTRTCINAIFLSYAASLIVPRLGEVMRCGILKRYDGVSFSKSLGTVVTERVVDSVLMLLIAAVTLLLQLHTFNVFFAETGVSLSSLFERFTVAGYWVTGICGLVALVSLGILLRRLAIFSRVSGLLRNMMAGIFSVKKVRNLPLFGLYSVGVWACYFFHFFLTFYAFGFTANLGWMAGLVSFVVGTIAVIVPTPNGAGPWHFAVKTILVLYGVAATQAALFALVVHAIQTALLLALGLFALMVLALTKRRGQPNVRL